MTVGFREVTFAAVADRLGVGQATVYRHAANRDELVRLGLEEAVSGFAWPDLTGRWDSLLRRWAVASWRAWEKHPGAVFAISRGVIPPSIVGLADRIGGALVERGFIAADAVLAVDLVFDLAADNRRGVEALDTATVVRRETAARGGVEHGWRTAPVSPGPEGQHEVRAEMVRAIRVEPVEWFERKLGVVLAGIAQELAPRQEETP
ncbi:Transcriptional regulator, TetR family [Microbacterium esteraromaticum]|uniref:Transcriptional regulator, TetR family n=1 Tax=Microbacterium esteraromaticum TaxID=57043 RepID=A0A1R4KSJ2_9MICO|nr:Transcriptional regulator, TetR family [Microbacterium esteraromaticum]